MASLIRIPGALFATIFLRRIQRRPIFFLGAILTLLGHSLLGLVSMAVVPPWAAILGLISSQFGYTAGYSNVANLLMGELLPANLRSIGCGLIATIEGLFSLLQNYMVPLAEDQLGREAVFFAFAVIVALCFAYAFLIMPETSGLSLEEIENIWQSSKKPGCSVRRDIPSMKGISRASGELKRMLTARRSRMRKPDMKIPGQHGATDQVA